MRPAHPLCAEREAALWQERSPPAVAFSIQDGCIPDVLLMHGHMILYHLSTACAAPKQAHLGAARHGSLAG